MSLPTPRELAARHITTVVYRPFLRHWVAWCEANGLTSEGALTPEATKAFGADYAKRRRSPTSASIAQGLARQIGSRHGYDYKRKVPEGQMRDCACGEGRVRYGGTGCDECMKAQRALLARGRTPEAKLVSAWRGVLRDYPASEVGPALGMSMREVWLRYCGRTIPTREEIASARRFVGRWWPAPPTLEDFIYGGHA